MVTMWVCGSSSVWLKGNMFWFPTRWFLKWSICSGSKRFCYNCVFKLSLKSTLLARERTLISWNTILEARCSNNCVTVTFVLLTASGPELGCDVFADLADVFQREFVQHSSNLLWNIRDSFELISKKLGSTQPNYLTVILMSKIRLCITGHMAAASSIVVVLAGIWVLIKWILFQSFSLNLKKCVVPPVIHPV